MRFGKINRLRLAKDFELVKADSTKADCSAFVFYLRATPEKDFSRLGVVTSRKVGCAVERNRARRVIRAAFSQLEDGVTGWDLVFVARSRTTRVKMQVVLADMEKQLTALGVLSHEEHR